MFPATLNTGLSFHLRTFLLFFPAAILFTAPTLSAQNINNFYKVKELNTPWFVDFADLNFDSIPDMVGVNGNSNRNIEIHIGNGDGTFTFLKSLEGEFEHYGIILKDLNQDKVPDIIAMSYVHLTVFLSKKPEISSRTFVEYVLAINTNSGGPDRTLIDDFNNDGLIDAFLGSNVYLNTGTQLIKRDDFFFGNGSALCMDYNNDSKKDIVIANPGTGNMLFYSGTADGEFSFDKESFEIELTAFASHDLNNDGLQDIIAKNFSNQLILIFNDQNQSFEDTIMYSLNHQRYSILKVADIDLDGLEDIITSDDNGIQFRTINGTLGNPHLFHFNNSIREVKFENVSGDEEKEMIIMSGFGLTKVYSKKIESKINANFTEKDFDGLPVEISFTSSVEVDSIAITYPGLSEAPTKPGTYEVLLEIIDPEYRGYTKGIVTIHSSILGLSDGLITKVYPNPVKENLTIESSFPIKEIKLIDLNGACVRQLQNTNQLNVRGLSKGLYILYITDETGRSFQEKVILE